MFGIETDLIVVAQIWKRVRVLRRDMPSNSVFVSVSNERQIRTASLHNSKLWSALCPVFSFSSNLECCFGTLFLQFQQPLALQILYDFPHTVLDTLLVTPDVNLSILRRLIRRTDAGELWNLALSCLLVQPFRVTRFSNLERQINKDLNEGQGGVGAGGHGV